MTGLEKHMLIRRTLQPKTENISTSTSVDKLTVTLLEIVAVIFQSVKKNFFSYYQYERDVFCKSS